MKTKEHSAILILCSLNLQLISSLRGTNSIDTETAERLQKEIGSILDLFGAK